jgi:hypothetical protein
LIRKKRGVEAGMQFCRGGRGVSAIGGVRGEGRGRTREERLERYMLSVHREGRSSGREGARETRGGVERRSGGSRESSIERRRRGREGIETESAVIEEVVQTHSIEEWHEWYRGGKW